MDKHNMHTIRNHNISPEKMSVLCTENKNDALSIIKWCYEKNKNLVEDNKRDYDKREYDHIMRSLGNFFNWEESHEKEKQTSKKALMQSYLDANIANIDVNNSFNEIKRNIDDKGKNFKRR